ncbi:MAG: PHP domain-containing protein [Deltaproteobacteria bacterium]|nr:PHP domain-containing protein [Deltaproteobacteria bacterium]
MGRRAVADALNELAFCAELLGDARVDPKGCSGIAWAMRSIEVEGSDLLSALLRLPDMTPRLAAVVDDALADRSSPFVDELKRQLPAGLFAMRRLKGLGPKKIQKLWTELGIESLGELEYACKENRLITLDGFGEKTQAVLMEQMATAQSESGLMRRDQAERLVSSFLETCASSAGLSGLRAELAGDLRRGCELVADVVVVTTGPAPAEVAPRVRFVASVPAEMFGTALLLATGSDTHLEALRAHAKTKGLELDTIKAKTDDDVYAALGLWPIAPEQREAAVVLVEVGKARPQLVERKDLRGALHNHTTASDGVNTLQEMATAAGAWGLQWMGVSDHSASAVYAHGLDVARLRAQQNDVVAVNKAGPVRVLTGVESDILKDGSLDYEDVDLLALDVVVASMHQRYGLKGDLLTARLVKAALHRAVDVVGHPTGRLLLSRPAADFDVSALLEACQRSGCAIELNANPARLDLAERWLREAKERGVLVSIAADAHAVDEFDNLHHGLALARRAGLRAEDVLNTRSVDEVMAWVKARRASHKQASAA